MIKGGMNCRFAPCASLVLLLAACGDDGVAGTDSSTGTPGSSTGGSAPSTSDTPTSTATNPTTGGPGETTRGSTGQVSATEPGTTSGSTSVDPSASESNTGSTTGVSTGSSTGADVSSGGSTGDPPCPEGTIVCEGDNAKTCDGMGGFKDEQACPDVCIDGVGCKLCVPGEAECMGDNVLVCNDNGDAKDIVDTCDGIQGVTCNPDAGACEGACSKAALGLSYIGCDYYPTVLQQQDSYNTAPTHEFSVAVSNTSNVAAMITVTRGANMVVQQMVAANSVQIIALPWVNELTKSAAASILVKDGAYRLRSNNPVTVYQYNPIKATTTNDASVLLPVNTWTGNYLVASWDFWPSFNYPGFYAVVARADGTKVTITPSATGNKVRAGGGVAADGNGVVMLDDGDVLEVVNSAADLTGTIITADKPVQVFGGHECTNVPLNVTACDHLEESMFPIETLAKEYLVVPPVQVPNDQLEKAQMVRVIASEANTTLVFDPDQPVNKNLAKAGDFVQIPTTTAKFLVTADKKIMVAQYMVGQDGGFGTSDPAMLLAVNPLQWRKSYLVHAPVSWIANYVDLMAKTGTAVSVDGVNAGGWKVIGNTGYSYTHVKLSNNGNGNHSIVGDAAVGVGVYGVQNYGSYWYPGGLDLDVIPQ